MADEDEVISANNNGELFEYMGGDMVVPDDVVRARVDPSVAVIPEGEFQTRNRLKEIELHEGLTEIGNNAFWFCSSLKHVNIPSTVKIIGTFAFYGAPLQTLHLPDSVESIGDCAFCFGRFPNVRIPPLVTTIAERVYSNCSSIYSVELPETIARFEGGRDYGGVFDNCRSLRNMAVPQYAVFVCSNTFKRCTDLLQIFDSESQIINALKHRFDNLPIHKMIYYHSYNNLTSEQLERVVDMRSGQRRTLRSKLNPTGNQQDCLGMTPLHILACSTVHHLELYQVLIEKYPENLITKDEWGTVPLLYAMWGNAPSEIVQLLVKQYLSIYPDYEFDWTGMITTLGERCALESSIQSLLDLQKVSFPAQKIDWDKVLNTLSNVEPYNGYDASYLKTGFQFLVKVSISTRVDAIGVKLWRDDMVKMTTKPILSNQRKGDWLEEVKSKLSHYEAEYQQLKEATSILELAVWKTKLDGLNCQRLGKKRRKVEDSDLRNQCRVNCGANIVIEHVLNYLIVPPVEGSTDNSHSCQSDDDISSSDSEGDY